MKLFKQIIKIVGVLALIAGLCIGFIVGKKMYTAYSAMESLTHTVLGIEIEPSDLLQSKDYSPGKIHSKRPIDLAEITPLWEKITEEGQLKEQFQHLEQLNFYVITYKSGAQLVNGIVIEPKDKGVFPVVIFNRGGNKVVGKAAKAQTLFAMVYTTTQLAAEGHVIVGSCYRENDEFGGEDLQDVLILTETITEIEKADPQRIGMFGWSRGGMMTYLALKESKRIKTAVVGNGPSDMVQLIEDRPEMESKVCAQLIPNYASNKAIELEKRSVIHWADQLNKESSLLILSGTEDQRVKTQHADKIAKKLTDINYDFELRKFETNHSFKGKKEELNTLLVEWFQERL